jgi:hypothetical protein
MISECDRLQKISNFCFALFHYRDKTTVRLSVFFVKNLIFVLHYYLALPCLKDPFLGCCYSLQRINPLYLSLIKFNGKFLVVACFVFIRDLIDVLAILYHLFIIDPGHIVMTCDLILIL